MYKMIIRQIKNLEELGPGVDVSTFLVESTVVKSYDIHHFLTQFSSFIHLQRVIAWYFYFSITLSENKKLTESQLTLLVWCKLVQNTVFNQVFGKS